MQKPNQNQKVDIKKRCTIFSIKLLNYADTVSNTLTARILINQLVRAGTSIGANVVEAFGSGSKKDFTNFFTIALKSAKETSYWLYLCKATQRGDLEKLSWLSAEIDEITRIIASSILTAKGKR